MLGGRVGAVEREGALGLNRGDVDECPATLSLEVGQCGHRPVYLTHEVHIYDTRELLGGGLLEGGEEAHCGEVHPGVEPTVLLDCAVGHSLYLIELRSVGGDGDRLAAFASYLFHQGTKARLTPGRDHHLRAPPGEPEGGLPTYAAGGAHQRHHLLLYWLQLHKLIAPCSL